MPDVVQEPKAPALRHVKREEPKEEPRATSNKTREEPRHREPEPAATTSSAEVEVKDTMRCVLHFVCSGHAFRR